MRPPCLLAARCLPCPNGRPHPHLAPPAQLAPMPEEFREWAQDTLLATMAGMVFGGGRSWLEESRRGESGLVQG